MAQSYTRQSTFVDGDTITAALFNNEYNQLENAFNYSSSSATATGHRHDGTAGHGGNVHTIGDLDFLNKIVVDSTNNRWGFFVEVSSSAVEQIRIQDGAIVPVTDNDIDLGTSSLEFKDGYFDGTIYADAINFNGTAISATAAELNIMDGVTSTTAELNILDGVTSTASELNILDGVTSTAAELNILDGVTATTAELNILDGVTASATDINLIDGITNGTVIASKAIITDSNKDITGGRNITISGELDAATLDISGNSDIAGTLAIAGGSTDGLVLSQGAISLKNGGTQSYIDFYCESSNAHYARLQAPAHSSFGGNITATLPATTGTIALTSDIHTTEELQDIIGAMFSGNTETDITVTYQDADGTIDLVVGTLNQDTTGTAALATSVTVSANNSTDETIFPVFVDGATGSQGLETDTGFTYNPSSGNLTIGGELSAATLDISGNVDIDGTLEADAITVNGTTLAETISDTVGAMVSSNTETGISVTYDDSDNTLDFVIGSDVIVNSMIADDAIDSAQIADGSIDTAHIADDQVTGDKLANDITIANNLTVAGNLAVTGTTTQTGSVVSDSNFTGLTDENTGNSTDFGFYGKYVESSTTKYAGLFYDASTDNTFRLFTDTQTVPSTTVNTSATGYAAASLVVNSLTGTIATAAQPNITSLGTLTALTGGTGDFNWDSNTLVVDSSTNRVGILNAAPDVSLDIGSATDAVHVPVGTTAQRPGSPAAGYFRYNSTTGKFEGYTDEWGSIGGGSGTNMDTNIYAGDGSTTAFTLSNAPDDENNLMVFVDGVFQAHDAYSVSGTTLTLSAAPASGRVITVYHSTTTVGGSNNTINTMTGDNSDTTLTLSVAPVHENNVQVYFDGVYQSKSNYSISGTTLTFSTAPPTGVLVEAITNTNTSSTTANQLLDADSDTKIQVEESSDEDKIRFDVAGTEEMVMDATGIVINDGSNDRDFRIESNGSANMLFVDGGNDEVVVQRASSGATATAGSVLIVEDDDNTELSLLGGSSSLLAINFGHSGDADDGIITYNTTSGSEAMGFTVNASNRMTIDKDGNVGIGVTPAARLHAYSTSAETLRLEGNDEYTYLSFRGTVSSSATSLGLIGYANQSGTAADLNIENTQNGAMTFATNDTIRMTIDNSGHVTMPKQSAFLAIQSVAVNNIATDASDHNIGYGNEIIDQNADYNNSTYTFTAPVTGRYQLQSLVYLANVDADCTYIILRIKTSNRNYSAIMRPDFGADLDRFHLTNAVLADMDASDTAVCTISQYEGTAQMDAVNSTGYFSGYLVA